MSTMTKNEARQRRKIRIRKKISGTAERPRLVIFRSNLHMYAQVVDDLTGATLAATSTLVLSKGGEKVSCNKAGAEAVGKEIARLAKEKSIEKVVFDRNGYLYHGKIKAVADGAREGGLEFSPGEDSTVIDQKELGIIEKIVSLNRVAIVVNGGRRFSFSALMGVGDGNGNVGFGLGKAQEVPEALRKATEHARKNMVKVPLIEGTLPYEIHGEFGAGRVMLKPASRGTGIIAGGPVRAVMEAAGIRDIRAKCLRSNNPQNVVKATMQGLESLRGPEQVAAIRGKSVEEIVG